MLLTVVAFRATISSIARQVYQGDPLGYLVLLPLCALVIAGGSRRRLGPGLPIHDREVDWLIAVAPAGLLVMIDLLLFPRLGQTQELYRVDVLALICFVGVCSVLIFGARSSGRAWPTWAFLLLCWPFPYRLTGAAFGGTPVAFAVVNVVLCGIAMAIGSGHRLRAWSLDIVVAAGSAVVLLIAVVVADAPALVMQVVPGVVGLMIFGVAGWRRPRVGASTKPSLKQAVPKPATALMVLAVGAVLLGVFSAMVPPTIALGSLPSAQAGWSYRSSVPGWKVGAARSQAWAPRYFGANSRWQRYVAAPLRDRSSQRPIVIDALDTDSAGLLSVYPAVTCYGLHTPYVAGDQDVALGDGVTGQIFYSNVLAAQSPIAAQWVLLTWTWKIPDSGSGAIQRMVLLTVDGEPTILGVPRPEAPGVNGGIRTTFSDIIRGAPTATNVPPSPGTTTMLERFARSVVAGHGAN